MKYCILCLSYVLFSSSVYPAVAENRDPDRNVLVTVEDLLRQKHLPLYVPSSQSTGKRTGLITAEDLLRIKGLLKGKGKKEKQNGKKKGEDVWELEKDLGC
jgi:hypothetical protein